MKKVPVILLCLALLISLSACSIFQGKGGSVKSSSPKGKITIRWKNESEHENYGFNIYRGETKDGSYVKINKDIIPGAGTTDKPTEYVYVDQPLEIGKVYYYYIESVSFAGVKEEFTPKTKVVVKTVTDKETGKKKPEEKK